MRPLLLLALTLALSACAEPAGRVVVGDGTYPTPQGHIDLCKTDPSATWGCVNRLEMAK